MTAMFASTEEQINTEMNDLSIGSSKPSALPGLSCAAFNKELNDLSISSQTSAASVSTCISSGRNRYLNDLSIGSSCTDRSSLSCLFFPDTYNYHSSQGYDSDNTKMICDPSMETFMEKDEERLSEDDECKSEISQTMLGSWFVVEADKISEDDEPQSESCQHLQKQPEVPVDTKSHDLFSEQLQDVPTVDFNDAPRAVLGCIQVPLDRVLDVEGPALVAQIPGVQLLLQKIEFDCDGLNTENLLRNAPNTGRAAGVFLPRGQVSILGLACTSMSFCMGPEAVDGYLTEFCPGVKTTDMARAQIGALRAVNATRVAMVTPYIEDLSAKNQITLESAGFQVVRRITMGLESDMDINRVSEECLLKWAISANCPEADALVIGCSSLRACGQGFIDEVEKVVKKPVITSTQAFLWKMLRDAGIHDCVAGYGELFQAH